MSEHEGESDRNPGGIELRVIGGEAPSRWRSAEVREEPVRLVKTGVAGVKSVADLEPATAPPPPRDRERTHGRLTLVMSVLVAMLVVGAVAWVQVGMRGDAAPGAKFFLDGLEVTYEEGEDPRDPFLRRTESYLVEARERLKVLAAAGDVDEVIGWIRDGQRLGKLLRSRWTPPELEDTEIENLKIEVERDTAGRERVVLSGPDRTSVRARFVFVPEDGVLLFDWAASVGANEPGLDTMRTSGAGATADLRLEVGTDHFHDFLFPEREFHCFKVTDRFCDATGWVYARRDSAVAEEVLAALHAGGTILEQEPMRRMILRVRNTGAGERGRFELVEVVEENWVLWKEG